MIKSFYKIRYSVTNFEDYKTMYNIIILYMYKLSKKSPMFRPRKYLRWYFSLSVPCKQPVSHIIVSYVHIPPHVTLL